MAEPLHFPDTSINNVTLPSGKTLVLSGMSDAAQRDKLIAASQLSQQMRRTMPNGVVIHDGPSADRSSIPGSSAMPSISESPLEQDFTVEGTPSKLGCPFASMENKRLSAHAASVVSRYRPEPPTPRSSVSRINGRASSVAKTSMTDPIRAETCAMEAAVNQPDVESSAHGSTGVCPIRFMDQHSPEEVAAYFESHKHELPRSHEVCVKRYQSNEQSIAQLDAKYGNLVSMIQGLGQKHVSYLPDKIVDHEEAEDDHLSAEKIRKWADSVDSNVAEAGPAHEVEIDNEDDDDRQSRFERPLKDVRLGESPSRPWGIQIPLGVDRRESYVSSVAAPAHTPATARVGVKSRADVQTERPRGCPFGFDKPAQAPALIQVSEPIPESKPEPPPEPKGIFKPVFLNSPPTATKAEDTNTTPQMVFQGPVFIGYSVEDAMRVLQASQRNNA